MAKAREDIIGKMILESLKEIHDMGTYKKERIISSAQGAVITVNGKQVLNFCSNNYLGLSNHPKLIEGAIAQMKTHGFGLSSVRFICGTQDIHKQLEQKVSEFHGTEDTILFSSCFDANGGVFEALLSEKDAVISDQLNHASIIDGIRLCKANRYRYNHRDMANLEELLKEARQKHRVILVCTDGVFSMHGTIAPLKEICDLCQKYEAIVMVDESHAAGFLGPTGRGAAEFCGVANRIDIISNTLGKALGGASGGYITGRKDVIELLRQRCRPYLFSNTLPPPLVGAYLQVFDVLSSSTDLKAKLDANTALFRKRMAEAGFALGGDAASPIAPVMLGDARLASEMADEMLNLGIYVIGFSYPVVPKGEARIRVQLSAAHSLEQVNKCCDAFITLGKQKGLIK